MIAPETLTEIKTQAAALGLSEQALVELRRAWPAIHFTYCSEDEVPARLSPYAEGEGFDLFLVSNAEHCVAFTGDPAAATGVVLAERSED